MIKISDFLYVLPSTINPLSSDVYIIKGKNNNYIFDVGINKNAREILNNIENKIVIISHFHQDHIGNLKFLNIDCKDLYIGDYTFKILGYGKIVKEIIEINDLHNIKIIPMPNSHSKGALSLLIDDYYILLGDSLYCNQNGYNVSLLYNEIKLLDSLNFKYAFVSHNDKLFAKEEILNELKYYYSKKEKNKPYISFKSLGELI